MVFNVMMRFGEKRILNSCLRKNPIRTQIIEKITMRAINPSMAPDLRSFSFCITEMIRKMNN